MTTRTQVACAVLALACMSLLAACGGGSKSGTADNRGQTGSTPISTTVSSDGSRRTINADCPVSQTLGEARGDNLRIDSVRWLQTVEMRSDDPDTRLAGGKAVKLRIDVLATGAPYAPARRELRVYNPDDRSCTTIPVTGPSRVPVSRNGESLSGAFLATIPATLVRPGMTATLVLDDASGRSAGEADQTFRVLAPEVAPAVKEVIRVIPLTLLGNTGYGGDRIAELLTRLYPVSEVEVRIESPLNITTSLLSSLTGSGGQLLGSLNLMQSLLDTVDDLCASLNGRQSGPRSAPKCLALIPDNLIFGTVSGGGQTTGLAFVGGVTMLARSVSHVDVPGIINPYDASHWITYNAMTVAHEYGHLLDLDHGNCGGATGLDPRLYADGRLGGMPGYDAARNIYFSTTRLNLVGDPMFADVMSYCGKEWMSDRGYLAAMAYRSGAAQAQARTLAGDEASQWLKLSPTGSGWKMRRAHFAPATLAASTLRLEVSSDLGVEILPLRSAVISEQPQGGSAGPFYVDLGRRQAGLLRLLSEGVELARWQAAAL